MLFMKQEEQKLYQISPILRVTCSAIVRMLTRKLIQKIKFHK